ncbi:MAG: RDD family protein [Isosphaeraceae bacterium]|nr:RDD family protein [Isosphaeraceae bacterium]
MATASLTRSDDPLDTTVRIVTPERIVFLYPVAGPFRRAVGYFIDLLVICAIVMGLSIAAQFLTLGSMSGMGPILVGYFVIVWGYGAFCEGLFNGQTVGKRAMGLRVVSDQGIPITGAQAVLRNLVGTVDGIIPFWYLGSLTSMMLTRKFQRLGDLAAGTMVVVEERRRRVGVVRVKDRAVEALLPWLPLRVAAGPEMARALSDYVKHRGRFGPARREEMAAHLARPLRERYKLPPNAPSDTVLCAVYHRVFLGD